MKKRQGLLKFTPCIEREDGEKTRITQVYSLYRERGWREDKDYSGWVEIRKELLFTQAPLEEADYLGLHCKVTG